MSTTIPTTATHAVSRRSIASPSLDMALSAWLCAAQSRPARSEVDVEAQKRAVHLDVRIEGPGAAVLLDVDVHVPPADQRGGVGQEAPFEAPDEVVREIRLVVGDPEARHVPA